MSMLQFFGMYKPVENPEFGAKKKLIGDAVCQVKSLEKITGKTSGKPWIFLKAEAIHAIPDPKGRETTITPGDEVVKFYNPEDEKSLQELANDMFTAGIEFEKDVKTEDELFANMGAACTGKLIYFRTWAKDKTPEQIEKSKPGSEAYYQNIVIKSKNLITDENSTAELPF